MQNQNQNQIYTNQIENNNQAGFPQNMLYNPNSNPSELQKEQGDKEIPPNNNNK